ncbi:uncharacterized protein LOC122296930 [Carya illinoinensis]|uniref:uncharacterized protein LOC122296930 n=1 Tax=Carya illinoinensis TaxID=32201 RepID=UPI001C719493|nr:uncharacterized protein LOC122296930 [Carya illinoinensis]
MSNLVWNYRELGNPWLVRILSKLTKEKCPFLVFLVETKARKQKLENVRRALKFDGCFAIDSMGSSGGIALLWKVDWNVRIISYTRCHISASVKEGVNGHKWQFTGFYGHPKTAKRKTSWQLLEMLKPPSPMAWMCAGDFNEILHQEENKGLPVDPTNKLRTSGRYEAAWDLKEECKKIVEYSWKGTSMGVEGAKTMRQRLIDCQRSLSQWNHKEKMIKHKDINHSMRRIRHLQETGIGNHLTEMQSLQKEVELSMATEEIKWRQRAKQHWMKVGDRNTTWFHLQASHRRKTNTINNLEDPQGRVLTKQEDIGDVFTGYFSSLFTTSSPSNFEDCLNALDSKLTIEMKT